MQLYAEVQQRLKSSGGRPTNPERTLKRVVPFRQDRWDELEREMEAGGEEALEEALRRTG